MIKGYAPLYWDGGDVMRKNSEPRAVNGEQYAMDGMRWTEACKQKIANFAISKYDGREDAK